MARLLLCVIASDDAASLDRGLRFFYLGCWHNDLKSPVLKHGPRSLTSMRVFGCKTRTRNESERRWGPIRVHHRPILMCSDGFE